MKEWVKQEIKEMKKEKHMEANQNENMIVQNLCNAAKVDLRGKYIVIQAFLKRQEESQTLPKLTP